MTTAPFVAVLDYGSGNVHSAVRAVQAAGAHAELTAERARIEAADGLLVPGVGAFAAVMEGLAGVDGVEIIRERHAAGRPLLGICVGMQVLFSAGTEHGVRTPGIGLWDGEVVPLRAPVVPHMGWTRVAAPAGSRMFAGLGGEHFYFVHSYAASSGPAGALTTTAEHGGRFAAAVEDGTTWAAQFHPEKSAAAGAALLRNWVASLSEPPRSAGPNPHAHEPKDTV
ncbi:imidazole glycerol phosphate synthase subunit HisH [Brevibacterium album]|uniref:imidazole glycerol phosphate synthase subunit HisH n=1 Tax=Brevibacterium album TaxID=417948 RepID=UPI000424FF26|nr:imidazole glycerol phosphate synthase subunit HisH [Brevibacterium album]